MPELPEVETIRRQLLPVFKGERISRVKAKAVRIFQNTSPTRFSKLLTGKKIIDIKRYGKFCIFNCDGVYPVFHLGMSGIFLQDKSVSLYPQHIHVQFYFASKKQLYFQDVRKFGKVWIFEAPPEFPGLGIDPTIRKFTLNKFRKLLNLRQMRMKLFLMDQRIIAGIGNIYANEILFKAGISPFRKSNELNEGEISRLYFSIKSVLSAAIKKFGTSYSAYRTISGEQGTNQKFLQVYQRTDQKCYQCGNEIKKVIMGSRSTFFCPNCQR